MVESINIVNTKTQEHLYMDKENTEDYILDYVDWGVVEAEHFTSKYINQIGVTINSSSFKEREIEISGFIIAGNEDQMTERKKFINGFVNPQVEYEAIYRQYKINFFPRSSVRYANTEENENNEVICRFKINGICPNPLFSLSESDIVVLSKKHGEFRFPFSIEQQKKTSFGIEITSENRRRVVLNKGTVEIGVKFTFNNTWTQGQGYSEIIQPCLYNFTTNQSFTINRPLYPGQFITVDTNIGSKKIIGGFKGALNIENYYKYKSLESQWITLIPGENLIGYGADMSEDLLSVTLEIDNKYLEVQECY